jgi:uncharacterized protein
MDALTHPRSMDSVANDARDLAVLEVQLGRPTQGESRVVRRCHLSLPIVVEVAPITDDGRPFPTLYWLTCPLSRRRVARVEERGEVKALDRRTRDDAAFERALERAHEAYAEARAAKLPERAGRTPTGGIGGTSGGVKCLHAHLAEYLVLGGSPAGQAVHDEVMPLACEAPCVAFEGTRAVKNPEWREPK